MARKRGSRRRTKRGKKRGDNSCLQCLIILLSPFWLPIVIPIAIIVGLLYLVVKFVELPIEPTKQPRQPAARFTDISVPKGLGGKRPESSDKIISPLPDISVPRGSLSPMKTPLSHYSPLLKSGFILLFSILYAPCSFYYFIRWATDTDLPPLGISLMAVVSVVFVLPLIWASLQPAYLHIEHFLKEADKRKMHYRKVYALKHSYEQKLAQYHREVQREKFRSLSDLQEMTPERFEEHIAYIFKQMGYQTEVVGGPGDYGVDIEAQRGKELVVIQCKRYQQGNKVPSRAVRDFIGAMLVADAHRGYFVTTSSFTKPAYEHAARIPRVTLVDSSGIVNWWQEYKLGPYKQLTRPQPPGYPPSPSPTPPPPTPAITIMRFSVWQWIILMILSEATLAVITVFASLLVS